MKWLAFLGAGLTGLTGFALQILSPWAAAEGSTSIRLPLVATLAVTVAVYFLAVRLSLRRALPAQAIWIVLAVAVAMRSAVLFTPPILSSDVYRYVWDGRVQAAAINPYLFVPADPALAALRDDAIYPHINRANYAPTIYPPMAQIAFAAMTRVSQTVIGEKLFMLAFEALAMFCAWRVLALARLPPERLLIYAWNPLTIWSFACDGHVDAVSIALLAGALLLRCRVRDGLAGAVFGAAILVKFLPAVVGPALWRRGGGWRLAGGTVISIVALYGCYAGAGWKVFGFLPGYQTEEGLGSGSGIWLLAGMKHLAPLTASVVAVYGVVTLAVVVALGLWIMSRRRPAVGTPADVVMLCGDTALLAACVTVSVSPHYPWYFVWLALPSVVRPYRAVLWISAAPVVLYVNPFDDAFLWPSLVYVPAALLALADFHRGWSPVPASPSFKGIA